MKLTRWRIAGLAAALVSIGLAASAGAVFGALGRHSARFPLSVTNQAADSLWSFYQATSEAPQAAVPVGDDVIFPSTFTPLRARVFQIPIAERGGEGGALASVGDALLLLTHDGRFFSGSADQGFRKLDAIAPPENGYAKFFELTNKSPYDPIQQNHANYRYNGLASFNTASGAGLLISYTYFDGARACYSTRVSRYDFADAATSLENLEIGAVDWRLLYETTPCLPIAPPPAQAIHVMVAAGRIVVDDAAGVVYLASGNYDVWRPDGEVPISQDPSNDYGKVLAIDLATGASRRISLGHRNPQGITRDKAGRIWTVEHGPRGGDELNHIVEGRNYGWPLAVYGSGYDQKAYPGVAAPGRHEGFEQPTLAWLPSIGPGTVMAIDGFHEAWDGNLLIGAMIGQKLVHVRLVGERVVFAEDIPVGRRVRYLHQHSDGSIALWNGDNELMIITPGEQSDAAQTVETTLSKIEAPVSIQQAVRAKFGECMQCHSLESWDNTKAPSLANVFGSGIGATPYASYSPAMASAGGTWSRERLDAYLRDPDGTVTGTLMPDPGLTDATVRAGVIDVLEALKRDAAGP